MWDGDREKEKKGRSGRRYLKCTFVGLINFISRKNPPKDIFPPYDWKEILIHVTNFRLILVRNDRKKAVAFLLSSILGADAADGWFSRKYQLHVHVIHTGWRRGMIGG